MASRRVNHAVTPAAREAVAAGGERSSRMASEAVRQGGANTPSRAPTPLPPSAQCSGSDGTPIVITASATPTASSPLVHSTLLLTSEQLSEPGIGRLYALKLPGPSLATAGRATPVNGSTPSGSPRPHAELGGALPASVPAAGGEAALASTVAGDCRLPLPAEYTVGARTTSCSSPVTSSPLIRPCPQPSALPLSALSVLPPLDRERTRSLPNMEKPTSRRGSADSARVLPIRTAALQRTLGGASSADAKDSPHASSARPRRTGVSSNEELRRRNAESIRVVLREARSQAREFRVRVQLPMLAVGCGVTLLGLAAAPVLALLRSCALIGAAVALPGLLLLLLALVPSQPRTVRLAAAMAAGVSACAAALHAAHAMSAVATLTAPAGGSAALSGVCPAGGAWLSRGALVPCWWVHAVIGVRAARSAVHGLCALALAVALGRALPARAVLRALWASAACAGLFSFAALSALSLGLALAAGLHELAPELLAVHATLAFEGLVVGALALSPRFRTRVHAWLASRAEGVSAAATISSVLGTHSVESVLPTAQDAFRCISLDELALADISSAEPDIALYRRSRPAALGEVDAFISHS